MLTNLEAAAQNLAAQTGCPLSVARLAVRVEMAKMAVSQESLTLDAANLYLAPHGVQIKRMP